MPSLKISETNLILLLGLGLVIGIAWVIIISGMGSHDLTMYNSTFGYGD